jgi:uncharacterized protein YyaL (SSP411 family)
MERNPNRLIHEKSPYLLQHADNPVDWYPWGEEAFAKAYREDKMIFLSVGYSTCHWCHVMAHESFEDAEVARLLNDTFICVKVDREERPDIDKIYMRACQMLTGSGGWPLTVIMTPDKQPVFAATYIPKESRLGRTGMLDLIPKIREVWEKRRDDVLKSADQIVALIRQTEEKSERGHLSKEILVEAYEELQGLYDDRYGGFGLRPKFPMPHQIMFLLRCTTWSSNEKAMRMVEKTLQTMRRGGIYDHVGFGFHRYSTDEKWLVPHFEKMLYDQALLSMAYTEAFQATGHQMYGETAREVFSYVLRDMTAPAGGFYSAEDADTEGQEGRFYLWTFEEIEKVLGRDDASWFIRVFGVEKAGNYIDELSGKKTGLNILHLKKPDPELVPSPGISEESFRKQLAAAIKKLYAARRKRVHPHKDDKILTDWNGLMIAAFAKGARVFGDKAYLKASGNAIDFILQNMRGVNGRLLHRYREGEAAIAANLDDYAFLIWGLIECYEAAFDVKYLKTALDLQAYLTKHFWDEKIGGYYFMPEDSEDLIVRQKEIYDGAIPSGNSVAMLNLVRLARMTGNHEMEEQAVNISRAFAGAVSRSPAGHTQFLTALGFLEHPSYEVVIAGKSGAEDTEKMMGELRRHFLPNAVVVFRPAVETTGDIVRIAPFIKNLEPMHGKATAYVCTNFTCHHPTTNANDMLGLLNI